MIEVKQVSDGVFQVTFTGIDLRVFCKYGRKINKSKVGVLSDLMKILIIEFDNFIVSEGS